MTGSRELEPFSASRPQIAAGGEARSSRPIPAVDEIVEDRMPTPPRMRPVDRLTEALERSGAPSTGTGGPDGRNE